MLKYVVTAFCFVFASIFSFEQKPWLGDFLEFHLIPSFTYRYYPNVSRSFNPTSYSSNDKFTRIDLDVCFLPSWDAQVGIEFAATRKQTLGTQSGALQVRYQWFNDIAGDAISWTTGLNIRGVSRRSLKDVSCVYHDRWNFELVNAIGKEFATNANWLFRTFGFLGVGQANKGRPWVRGIASFEAHFIPKHRLQAYAEGYFGFGKTRRVNIRAFDGYANIFHQSVDVGLAYYYLINRQWGTISLSYSYRVLAKAFPKNAQTATIAYNFPFSIF